MSAFKKYGILFLVIFTAVMCKKKEEIVTKNGTELKISIKDQDGVAIEDEIDVYLFSNSTAYSTSLINEEPAGYDVRTKSNSSGVATFTNLDSEQYYIYINYEGRGYSMNNYFAYQRLVSPLIENATTSISVRLTPFNVGSIAFWTAETNLDDLDIQVWVGDSLIGSLPGVKNGQPSDIEDTQVLPIFYQTAGTFVWQARGANGCYWSGEFNLIDGATSFIELTTCNTGNIVIWGKEDIFAEYSKLSVYVNETEFVGELTKGLSSSPVDCSENSSSQVSISKPYGTYTYKITAENSDCVWIETFDITSSCSGDIEILSCK